MSPEELDAGLPHAYARRPAPVEAVRWLGWNKEAVSGFLRCEPVFTEHDDDCATLEVPDVNGIVGLTASKGDYIVRTENILTVWSKGLFDHLYQEAP